MFDLILRQGTIIDGTGADRYSADVGITGDKVSAIGNLSQAECRVSLDVTGQIVAPGFIDVHNHSDGWMLIEPHLEAKTRQGFTTEILMSDGISYAPVSPTTVREWFFYLRSLNGLRMDHYRGWESLSDYMRLLDRANVQNAATQLPYANVRTLACGFADRPVDDYQMQMIRTEVRRGLESGAVALSTGLDYLAQCFSTTEELVKACEPMRGGTRPYVTHVRYKLGLLPALEEAVEIGRRAEIPVHISHLKIMPPYRVEQVFEFLDRARRDVDLTFDVYPYQPGSTMLNYLLPYDAWREGPSAALSRLLNPTIRERLGVGLKNFRLDLDHIRIAWLPSRENAGWIGQPLSRYVEAVEKPPEVALADLLLEERLAVLVVYDEGDDQLVEPFLTHDLYMMGTDGIYFPDGHVHPRMYGSTGRFLGRVVRERGLLTLEQAVFRLSGFAAQRFGLKDRGKLKEGCFADVVVFDPETFADRATYDRPREYTEGVEHLLVNGETVLRHGKATDLTGRLPGRWV